MGTTELNIAAAAHADGEKWQLTGADLGKTGIRSILRDELDPDPARRYKALLEAPPAVDQYGNTDGGNVSGLTPAVSPTG